MTLQQLRYVVTIAEIGTISKAAEELQKSMDVGTAANIRNVVASASNYKTIELSCMVFAALPLIVIYPFLQKFFEKGVMVGSVKG